MTDRPLVFHYRLPTRRAMAFVGALIAVATLAFWISVFLSADQGTGGLLLIWIGILIPAVVLVMIVYGIFRPDAVECIVDEESIRWHVPGAPWCRPHDHQVKLSDIAEVHADLDEETENHSASLAGKRRSHKHSTRRSISSDE